MWEREFRLKKETTMLPMIILTAPKDDVVEYSSASDNW